jgi:hypothetical protein
MACQAELLQVIRAAGTVGRLADFLHGRQQERDQDTDNGDHDQELNQGETGPDAIQGNTSQIFTDPSAPAEASVFPSG